MTRPTASEQLSAWIDGELTDAEAAELEAELARDPSLRAELEELETVVRILHDEGPSEAPTGFRERLLARVEQEFPSRGRFGDWIRRPFGVPLEGWAVGALAAAVLFLTVLPALRRAPTTIEGEPAALEVRSLPKEEGTASPSDAPIAEQPQAAMLPKESTKPIRPTIDAQGTAEPEAEITSDEIVPVAPPVQPPPRVLDSYEGRQRFVASITDDSMKRVLLGYLGNWGGGTNPLGAEVASDGMEAPHEDLLVTIAQDDLTAFSVGLMNLRRHGIVVREMPPPDIVGGDTIEIVISLELVGDP